MYKLQKLNNGVRLITIPMSATQTFTILAMVATGSRHENKNNNGISHFLEHMFFKGAKKRPDTLAISTDLDKVGGEFNAFTSKEYTGYYVKVDGQHADVAIDVISDILLNSKFDAHEIKREKGVILEEINMYENNPLIHIDDLFEECVYGDNPAGWDTIGTRENIKKFKRTDFIKYFNNQYQGKDMVVGIAGNFKNKDQQAVKKLFGRLKVGEKNVDYKFTNQQNSPQLKIKNQKVEQVNLSLGVHAYGYHHKDFYIAKLLGIILGGSMSSRLFISVRERKGLAYQVHTQVEGYSDSGYLTTNIGTSLDKVELAIKTVLSEYKKISKQLINSAELKKAKDYLQGKTVLQLEATDNVINWYLRQEVLNREVVAPAEYFKKINSITASDIKRVAQEIFQAQNLNLAIIGQDIDEKKFKKLLKL